MSLMATSYSSSLPHVVFPSFHGPDVRSGILSHLRIVFARKEITMFDDNDDIERGHTIGPKLVEAITKAEVSIVLLSKNYASSIWCLNELLEILKCKEASNQIVIPVFYNVDPSDVRRQTGDFGLAFKKTCVGVTEEQKQRWIQALTRVANILGEDSRICPNEAAMLEKISTYVLKRLKVKKLWEEFRIRDVDHNDFITAQELRSAMIKNGGIVTDEEVRTIIKAADLDYDGRINYDEFVEFMDKDSIEKDVVMGKFPTDVTLPWVEKKEMIHTFRPLDADQKGYLTAAGYQKHVLTVSGRIVTDEDAANFIKNFDVDGDGRISFDEFVKLTR